MAVVRAPSGGRGIVSNPNQQGSGLATLVDSTMAGFKTAKEEGRAQKEHELKLKQLDLATKREERLGEVADMQLEKAKFELNEAEGAAGRAEEARDNTEMILGMVASGDITNEEAVQLGAEYGPETSEAVYDAISPVINWQRLSADLRGQNLSNQNTEETMAHNREMRPLQLAEQRSVTASRDMDRTIKGFQLQEARKKWEQQEQLTKTNTQIVEKMFSGEVPFDDGLIELGKNAYLNGDPNAIKKVFDMNAFVVEQAKRDHTVMSALNSQMGEVDADKYPVMFAAQIKSARAGKDKSVIDAIQRTTGISDDQMSQAVAWLDSIGPQERGSMDAYQKWFEFADQYLSPQAFPEVVARMEVSRMILENLDARNRKKASSQEYTQEEEFERDEDGNLTNKRIVRTPGSKGSKSTKPTTPSIDDTILFEGAP